MILFNKAVKAATNDVQRQMFTEIKTVINNTLDSFVKVQQEECLNKYTKYIDISNNFDELYKNMNGRFRNIFFGKSDKITTVNLYYKTYNKITYFREIENQHPEFEPITVNKFYTKFKYSVDALWALVKENLTLLYAKEGNNVNYCQIIVSYLKVVIECFNLQNVNWIEVKELFRQVITEFDDDELRADVIKYGTQPLRKRKSGLVYNTKSKTLDYIIKDMVDSGMKKTEICKELNIGKTTLFRIIKSSSLF